MRQDQQSINIGRFFKLCHLNIEGASAEKCAFLSHLALDNKVCIVAVQETHINNGIDFHTRGIPGFTTAAYITSRVYGIATYVREDLTDFKVLHAHQHDNIFQIVIEIFGMKIVNIYKPPNQEWPQNFQFHVSKPAKYVGDFNSHHSKWGYVQNDQNGIELHNWAEVNNLSLIHDQKDNPTFYSARWRKGYNPDLCFISKDARDKPIATKRKVLSSFPRSQHRPGIITVGIQVDTVNSVPKPRWNFQKADWRSFSARIESSIRFIPNDITSYERFLGIVKGSAKKSIPRGYRKRYIPCWTEEMEALYRQFERDNDDEISDQLLELLTAARKAKWEKTTEEMNFTHSSRKAWATMRHLGEAAKPVKQKPNMNPDRIASVIVNNAKAVPGNKHQNRLMNAQLKKLIRSLPRETEFCQPFTIEELQEAINATKPGKAAGLDGLYPEFIRHLGNRAKLWVLKFLNKIFKRSQLPPLLMKSVIIAILKPGKEADNPCHYRPIALLSTMYKLLEKLIYHRVQSQIELAIPPEFAGFRCNRSCTDQVLALTNHIEVGFEEKLKTGMMLLDLSSAYDTVWRKAFLWKFLKVIPSRLIGRLIICMLTNRRFRALINDLSSRYRTLNDGFAQGSVCAPPFFNLYTCDMPLTKSRKFGYADDLALTCHVKMFEEADDILSRDGNIMSRYYHKWRLKMNLKKTEVTIFHLDNRSASRELDVFIDGKRIEHNFTPTYLGLTLDRSLSYKSNLERMAQKLQCRNNLIDKLAGTNWCATGDTLRTATLSLVYSAAEYCAPSWYRSRHTNKIDVQLNISMRTVTGCVHSTPILWLHVLSNIAPPELRRKLAANREWNKRLHGSRGYDLPIKNELTHPPPHRLVSRNPIWLDNEIHGEYFDINYAWKKYWDDSPMFTNKELNEEPHIKLNGFSVPRKIFKSLNRFRCGHGCSGELMYRWNFRDSPFCDCNFSIVQSMEHIVEQCPVRRFPFGLRSLYEGSEEGLEWIGNLDLNI